MLVQLYQLGNILEKNLTINNSIQKSIDKREDYNNHAILSWDNHPTKKYVYNLTLYCSIHETTYIQNNESYGNKRDGCKQCAEEKLKKTNLEKYGVEYSCTSKQSIEKTKKTNLEKYGVESSSQNELIKSKMKITNEEKYGGTGFGSKELSQKANSTMEKIYGCHHSKTDNFKEKFRKTNKEIYGENNYGASLQLLDISATPSLSPIVISKFEFVDNYTGLYDRSKESKPRKIYKFKCKKCNHINEKSIDHMNDYPICQKCESSSSLPEQEIQTMTNGFKYRDEKEVDCLVTTTFGIEYNGLYFHSSKFKHKMYHQEKSLYFANKNIQIMHIWEHEWLNKRNICESMINNKLGKSTKVFARKCNIKEVSSTDSFNFLENNHLQGGKYAKYNYGLYYNNELVQLLTINQNPQYEYEIDRFATIINYNVVGGFQKLLSYFEKTHTPKSIMTYTSIDLNNIPENSVYYKSGFILDSITEPSFFYYKNGMKYSRQSLQKHKLQGVLQNLDESLSADKNLEINGYLKIYTCGNFKFLKTY